MDAATHRSTTETFPSVPMTPVQRNAMHLAHHHRSAAQIRAALRTKGRALGTTNYDRPAACALLEDLISEPEHLVNVRDVIELFRMVAEGEPVDQIGKQAIRTVQSAIILGVVRSADSLDEGRRPAKIYLARST